MEGKITMTMTIEQQRIKEELTKNLSRLNDAKSKLIKLESQGIYSPEAMTKVNRAIIKGKAILGVL